jgi:limonene-1,2-epoxide hydrolase
MSDAKVLNDFIAAWETHDVAGFFKVRSGKIAYWKDYFDGPTIQPIITLMSSLAKS